MKSIKSNFIQFSRKKRFRVFRSFFALLQRGTTWNGFTQTFIANSTIVDKIDNKMHDTTTILFIHDQTGLNECKFI